MSCCHDLLSLPACFQMQIAHIGDLRSALTAAVATPVDFPAVSLSPATLTAATAAVQLPWRL